MKEISHGDSMCGKLFPISLLLFDPGGFFQCMISLFLCIQFMTFLYDCLT